MLEDQPTTSKTRLLIVACSYRKHIFEHEVNAWDLYDGVAFRALKRLQAKSAFPQDVDILILSAKYGLIKPNHKVSYYDKKMDICAAIGQSVYNCSLLYELLQKKQYREIFICAGKTYLLALMPFGSWVTKGVHLRIAQGGIGQKTKQMKNWLLSLL